MRNLVNKELRLSIHWFYYTLPILLSCLMFIPQWIYSFVFMYFFWISATNIFSSYNAKADGSFNAMLPVTRKEIVQSKVVAFIIVQMIHLGTGLVFGIIHNALYGSYNFFFDINPAFFGIMLLMYALFNIVVLPLYFKTAYFFGRPVVYGVVATLAYAFIFEYGTFRFQFMKDIFEGTALTQWIVVAVSVVVAVILTKITLHRSIRNYESIS